MAVLNSFVDDRTKLSPISPRDSTAGRRTPMQSLIAWPITRRMAYQVELRRARIFLSHLSPHLTPNTRILDLGAGSCVICHFLTKSGMCVTPLDIRNLSLVHGVNPMIYGGSRIPFQGEQFDVTLIVTVLHHTSDPESIICEARRVSRRIIIVEDVYSTTLHKSMTLLEDSLANFEFCNHPHSNKTDTEWQRLFPRLGLRLEAVDYFTDAPIFQHALYCLERQD